jgi:hypothetical protein
MFDGDPATTADFASAVAAIIAGVGLILAKDAKNTTPDAATPPSNPPAA